MKKTNILKIFMTLVLAFVITGAFAQTYVQGNDINHTGDITDYVSLPAETIVQTVGYGLTLYAAPDPYISPDYDGTGVRGTDLNPSSEWRWIYDATGYEETGTAFEDDGNETEVKPWTVAENWVELTAAQVGPVGTRTFYVKEKNGCEGANGTAQSKTVQVIDAPDATMVAANTGGIWNELAVGTEYSICGDNVQDNLTLTFTELNNLYPTYVWNITATAIRYAGGNPVDENYTVIADPADATDVTGTHGIETVADISLVTSGDFVATPWSPQIPAMTYLTSAAPESANLRTKYVFTLTGISSRTLALSQKRAGVPTDYEAPTVTQQVTYWLNLVPVTGPIYHIPNNFAF